jgi:hypothetical protein
VNINITEGDKMNMREFIKIKMIESGIGLKELVEKLNEQYNKKETTQNLSNKMTRESLRYKEMEEVADILGYNIQWIKKNKSK